MSIPTCKEGLSLPTRFCTPEQVVQMAVSAERLGYASVWGNDHITPPEYVRRDYPEPPSFLEPLITLSFVAQATKRLRIGTSVLVLPMREPVYLAKAVSTLDVLSNGRFMMGVGVGAYREEFERIRPRDAKASRAALMDETLELISLLTRDPVVSFSGRHYEVDGLRLAPQPRQRPLPIYVGGNNRATIRRAARWGTGWFPAALGVDELVRGMRGLVLACEEFGRDPGEVEVAPQLLCAIARTHEQAVRTFRNSRMYTHLTTLGGSTLRSQALDRMEANNLIGSADEIIERIAGLQAIGVRMLPAMSFTSNTHEAWLEEMELFAADVIPNFAVDGAAA